MCAQWDGPEQIRLVQLTIHAHYPLPARHASLAITNIVRVSTTSPQRKCSVKPKTTIIITLVDNQRFELSFFCTRHLHLAIAVGNATNANGIVPLVTLSCRPGALCISVFVAINIMTPNLLKNRSARIPFKSYRLIFFGCCRTCAHRPMEFLCELSFSDCLSTEKRAH